MLDKYSIFIFMLLDFKIYKENPMKSLTKSIILLMVVMLLGGLLGCSQMGDEKFERTGRKIQVDHDPDSSTPPPPPY